MQNKLIIREYFERLARYRADAAACDRSKIDGYLPLLDKMNLVDGSSAALFDMASLSYRYLTDRFQFITGYTDVQMREADPAFFFSIMHPEDLRFVIDTSLKTYEFLYGLPIEERESYKLSFEYRSRQADGVYVRMLQQVVVLELNGNGQIYLVLIVNDRSPYADIDSEPQRSLCHIPTGKEVLFSSKRDHNQHVLTSRESEILGLISKGYLSREIASVLQISINTVNNHRQRIIEKLQVTNCTEAVSLAAKRGLF